MAKRIGVVLSGCGVFDGAEIHESVLTLLAIHRAGAQPVCYAPNTDQMHVINHLTGEEMQEKRNVLVESARIARGKIGDLAGAKVDDFDAIIFPGGFGAAKNLCTFAVDGPNAKVHPQVARIVKQTHAAGKPLGFLCISPAVAALVLGEQHVELTIGNDADTAAGLEKLGAKHIDCPVDQIHVDAARKIVTSPAYMLGQNVADVATGIERLVQQVVDWA
ncbi:MAG: isoprenoid biosynthesis glyoxalase ElbB [Verrucomicrobiota bacterium JB022]|nr:isoprenoid biosynthesis glyoxalase ElbB [Verrucomicrobiota bacterium JB022]